ncbi:MAG: flavodoxin family protein [Clostridiales Family XIII bacterium]|nr:flavodoxin family protein [Clostridiales Family XIII bacterium]
MRIVIINGSPRKNGATFGVLSYFGEYLKNNFPGTDVEFINLVDLNIKHCVGCKNCYKTGHCALKGDGVEAVHDAIKNCDGLVWGSPTYASNVSGLFKDFHDRVHMTMEQLLYKKPCVNVTTYENAMGNKTLGVMREMVMNAGGYNARSVAIKNPFNHDALEGNRAKIEETARRFIEKTAKNKAPLLSKIYTAVAVNVFLKPFVYGDKENNRAIIDNWKEKKIVK